MSSDRNTSRAPLSDRENSRVPTETRDREVSRSSEAAAAAAAPAGDARDGEAPPPKTDRLGRMGRFISTNSSFVSSFVIGGAGLIATSIYQCNQSEIQRRQAESQQRISVEQALNNWKIERAKILAQNLQTLTARGGDNVEQRYGVLLSLTRGSILEPDLAVSYALELGKDNPEYMRSVLANIDTDRKDLQHYTRLLSAYQTTCQQRYGVSAPTLEVCKTDALAERSSALAEVIADETELVLTAESTSGPLYLLRDDREVQNNLQKLVGIYAVFLQEMFERRQWSTIDRFLTVSSGARLVGTLALALSVSEAASSSDRDRVAEFRVGLETSLETYLLSPRCDNECRARVLSIMLSNFGKGSAVFERSLRSLLVRPRAEVLPLITRISGRLLNCQMDPDDVPVFRDQVLVPVLLSHLENPQLDTGLLEDLIGLVALTPVPTPKSSDPVLEQWKKLQAALYQAGAKQGKPAPPATKPAAHAPAGAPKPPEKPVENKDAECYVKLLADRRASVEQQRRTAVALTGDQGTAMLKKALGGVPSTQKKRYSFCAFTAQLEGDDDVPSEE